jgi:hypothetical protein
LGVDGNRHPWTGIGQSLVLLPADVVATLITRGLGAHKAEPLRFVMVQYLVFPIVNGGVALVGFCLLRLLGFELKACSLGVLGLLFASTFLWHAQTNQENPLLLLDDLAALACLLAYLQDPRCRWIAAAFGALGFSLLMRLPALADVLAISTVPVVAIAFSQGDRPQRQHASLQYLRSALAVGIPLIGLSLLVDRLYHFYRFGSWTGTYMKLYGFQARSLDPLLPQSFPFSASFREGFLGVFFSASKSVFLFDPLLGVSLVCLMLGWQRFSENVRAVAIAGAALLVITSAGYARFFTWGGGSSWSDRYVSAPVHLLCLLALPLAFTLRPHAGRWFGGFVIVVASASVMLQIISLPLPSWWEVAQAAPGVRNADTAVQQAGFIPARRARNLLQWTFARPGELGQYRRDRNGGDLGPPPPMLLPLCPLRSLSGAVRVGLRLAWTAGLTLLAWLLWQLLRATSGKQAAVGRGAPLD